MTARKFNAWRSYYKVFPFGDIRGDLNSGVIAATIANVNRGKGTRPYNPSDFMPEFNKTQVDPDEIIIEKINRFMKRYH